MVIQCQMAEVIAVMMLLFHLASQQIITHAVSAIQNQLANNLLNMRVITVVVIAVK